MTDIDRRLERAGIARADLSMLSVSPKVRQVNAWVLRREPGEADLYDAGPVTNRPGAEIAPVLDALGIGRIRRLVVSHNHSDHTSQADALIATHRCAVYGPPGLAADPVRELEDRRAFLRIAGAEPGFDGAEARSWHGGGAIALAEGARIELGRLRWRCETAVGHAPVSLLLFSESGGFALTADQLLPGVGSFVGVSLDDPAGDPMAGQLANMHRLGTIDRGVLCLPGHGEPFLDIPAQAAAQAAAYERRLERALQVIDRPTTCVGLRPALFRQPGSARGLLVQLRMAMALANHLVGRGALEVSVTGAGARLFARRG